MPIQDESGITHGRLNASNPSLIVPAMKKMALMLALATAIALPAAAQSTEFGFLYGGSSRASAKGIDLVNSKSGDGFSFQNSSIDLYWSSEFEEDSRFKIKLGRIEGTTGFPTEVTLPDGSKRIDRSDSEGQIEHASGLIEYRFSEFFGSTGLFAGVGLYRMQGGDRSETDYGFQGGVNGDFPINRRYGVIVEGTYHFTNLEFRPKYITVSAGLRFKM